MSSNGSVSQLEGRHKWIENNTEKHKTYIKEYWATNRECLLAKKRQLKESRENIVIDEKFADPTTDPESLFCSPKLLDIVDGKYQP